MELFIFQRDAVQNFSNNKYLLCIINDLILLNFTLGFPDISVDKESARNAGDPGSIPGLVRSPGEGNGNPFQYSFLENSTDRGRWWATSMGSQRVGHN